MASKWSLFGISIGCVLILMSYMVDPPYAVIVSGICVTLISAFALFKQKKKG